jgi:hypothetical protein
MVITYYILLTNYTQSVDCLA